MKKSVDTTCPECSKLFQTEVDVPEAATLDQIHKALAETLKDKQGISSDDLKGILQEQLSPMKPKGENHGHATSDELLDCPTCRGWFDRTIRKYTISQKEAPEPEAKKEPEEKPPTRPQIGSIFKEGG